jgi:signal transduction histidine kinase
MRGMAKEGLEDIRRSVRSMQDTENWFENREWDTVLNRFAGQVRMTSGINIGFINKIDVPLTKRYSVYQCMKEAVTNAIRHGDATDIIILQREHDGTVYIDISNNGKIPADSIVKGVGLTNLINRMQSVGGHVTFGVIDETFRVTLFWAVEEEKEVEEGR